MLVREDSRLQLGNLAVLVGITGCDRIIKFDVASWNDFSLVLEDNRDGNGRRAFRMAASRRVFAQCLVKEPGGGIAFKLDLRPLHVLIHHRIMGDATGQ